MRSCSEEPRFLPGSSSPCPLTLGMAARAEALSLYRRILRTAQFWPSIKKAAVIDEIRGEFRDNMKEADPQRTAKMLAEARAGLQSLRQQCGMSDGSDIQYMYDDALQRTQR